MSFLGRLFGKAEQAPKRAVEKIEQAVLVHLDGQGLSDEVYAKFDLHTLEEQLERAIRDGSLGEFDGNEVGPESTTLFMYGPDAERLFAGIEPVLRAYPLCRNAKVIIRFGKPGAEQRELSL